MIAIRLIRRISLFIAGLLLLGYTGLYLLQDRIIFQASPLDKNYVFQFERPFEEHFIPVPNADGTKDTLNALWFRSDSINRGTILYFHGNRGNLQRWGRYAAALTQFGYDVVVIDYRGYGKSTGQPSEGAFYSDAQEVFHWALQREKRIILYGRSIGSAVASKLAASVQAELLILETPFDEIRGVIRPYGTLLARLAPLKYTFSNTEHLRSARCRVVIFHGTQDNIVPLQSALRLKEFVAPDDFVILEGGTHRNLSTFPEYHQKLKVLLEGPLFRL